MSSEKSESLEEEETTAKVSDEREDEEDIEDTVEGINTQEENQEAIGDSREERSQSPASSKPYTYFISNIQFRLK